MYKIGERVTSSVDARIGEVFDLKVRVKFPRESGAKWVRADQLAKAQACCDTIQKTDSI